MPEKKNIGILEFHYHVKYLYTLAKIVKLNNTNVTVFTTPELFSKVKTYLKNDLDDYEIILKKEEEGMSSFLKRVENICTKKIDLLFINTIQKSMLDFPRFLRFKPSCKMILTIHTANAWFSKKPQLDLKMIFRTVDTNISTFFGRFLILPKFNAINVIYSPIKDFIIRKTDWDKPVFTIPFGFYENEIDYKLVKKNDNKLVFVLPGQIEEHRRDYDVVLDAFEKIFQRHNEKIRLILLGYPVGLYGKRILKRCEEFKEKGYNLSYYHNFIPEEEYDLEVKSVDFIILPIKILTHGIGVTKEYYGITKGNAGVFEAIQYGKPMIVPADFNMIKNLESSTMRYLNIDDLIDKIENLISNKKEANAYISLALKNANSFSIEVLQKYFREEILENIDSL